MQATFHRNTHPGSWLGLLPNGLSRWWLFRMLSNQLYQRGAAVALGLLRSLTLVLGLPFWLLLWLGRRVFNRYIQRRVTNRLRALRKTGAEVETLHVAEAQLTLHIAEGTQRQPVALRREDIQHFEAAFTFALGALVFQTQGATYVFFCKPLDSQRLQRALRAFGLQW